MPKAKLVLRLGRDAQSLLKIIDRKASYKRSRVSYRTAGDSISIDVTADDAVALLATLSSSIKQLRVITSVDMTAMKLIERKRLHDSTNGSVRQRDININKSKL